MPYECETDLLDSMRYSELPQEEDFETHADYDRAMGEALERQVKGS